MDEITIRPYEKGDERAINRAYNEIFNQHRSIEEWRWKFRPEQNASRIMIGLDGQNEVVSHFCAIFVNMQIDGRVLRLTQSLDAFCFDRPELVRKKIFIKTAKRFYQEYCEGPGEIPFYYGTPGLKLLRLGKLALNFKGLMPIDYYYRETSRLIRPLGMLKGGSVWTALASEADVSSGDIDDLWERSSGRYPVTLEKNGAYFNFRFKQHPVNKYMFIPAFQDNIISGLAVISYGERVVKWVDLLWDGANPDTLSYLFESAWGVTRKSGAVKLEMWLNNDTEASEVLVSHGMVEGENPYTFRLATCTFDDSLDADDIAQRFCFTMGDSDMF